MKQINHKKIDEEFDLLVLTDWPCDQKIKQDWEQLANNQPVVNVFITIEWLQLWWQTFASHNDLLHIIIIMKQGITICIAPFYLKEGRELRFIGTGEDEKAEVVSEFLDILIYEKHINSILKILAKHLGAELEHANSIEFNNILTSSHTFVLAKMVKNHFWQKIQLTGLRYIIDLPNEYQTYLDSLSKPFRNQTLRKKRKFEKLGGQIKRVTHKPELVEYFDILKTLHTRRWQSEGVSGAFSDVRFVNFHLQFMHYLLSKNMLSLTSLVLNDEVIAVIYNIKHQGTRQFYQMGTYIDFKPNVSAGTLLHLYEIEDSIHNGERYYDFLKGTTFNSYKNNFIQGTQQVVHLSLVKKSFGNIMPQIKFALNIIKNKIRRV